MTNSISAKRAAILARLIHKAPGQQLGRTALMKLLYFLQELHSVPLGYYFRLHTYGPFDPEVLSDLATATVHNIAKETTVLYAKGYGYEITPGPQANRLAEELALADPATARAIDEVVATFGHLSAAELELRSTILFVDREFKQQGTASTPMTITERVGEIKPYFPANVILERVHELHSRAWLQSIPTRTEPASPV